MEKYQEKFNKIVADNFDDPAEDYYATQYALFINTGRCLLNNTQLEILSDDDTRFGDLSSAYGISPTVASLVYDYLEKHGDLTEEPEAKYI